MIFPSFGMLIQALFLTGAIWLIIKMAGRFRDDLASLRKKHHDYLTRNDPAVLERMQTRERQENYQDLCVQEFRSEAVTLAFLWALGLLAGLYVVFTTVGIVRRILSAFL